MAAIDLTKASRANLIHTFLRAPHTRSKYFVKQFDKMFVKVCGSPHTVKQGLRNLGARDIV